MPRKAILHRYLIGIGSNLDPERHIPAALRALRTLAARVQVGAAYASDALGFTTPHRFVNVAAYVECALDAATLKVRLNRIEANLGRDRAAANSSRSDRTIDLDILAELAADDDGAAVLATAAPYERAPLAALLAARRVPGVAPPAQTPLALSGVNVGDRQGR